jgi:hypothetical protein
MLWGHNGGNLIDPVSGEGGLLNYLSGCVRTDYLTQDGLPDKLLTRVGTDIGFCGLPRSLA